MKEYLQNWQTKLIEQQILHDVLESPDLWLKIYKVLDSGDFIDYRETFDALCEIFKDKKKISIAYLYDKTKSVSDFIEYPVYPTSTFFNDFVEVLRSRRIDRELKDLSELHTSGFISGETFSEKLKVLEKKKLSSFEIKTLAESINDYYENYAARKEMNEKGESLSLRTGFQKFDSFIGLTRGELLTFAARTGIGKSAFCLNFALRVAERGKKVLFISVEMSNDQLFERIFAYETGMDCNEFKQSRYGTDKFGEVADRINEKYKTLQIAYLPQATSNGICSFARRVDGLGLLIIDYLQILKDPIGKNETNAIRIGEMTGRLKGLAGELGCVVVCISQVNREASKGFNKEPEIHQLRDSGSIEQDSDKVVFLNRDKDGSPDRATLYVAKNRSGEEEIKINYSASMSTMRFEELI